MLAAVVATPAHADLQQYPVKIEFTAGTVQQWVEVSNVSPSRLEVTFRVHDWLQTPTQEFQLGPETQAVTVVPPTARLDKGESIRVRLVLRDRKVASYRFISEITHKSADAPSGRLATLLTTGSPIFVGMSRFIPEMSARMLDAQDGLRLEMSNRGGAPAKLIRIDDGTRSYDISRYILPQSIQVLQLSGLSRSQKVLRFENGDAISVSTD